MGILSNLFNPKIASGLDSIAQLIDRVDNSEEKLKLQLQYKEMILELQKTALEQESRQMEERNRIPVIEAQGNSLQRSWRPLLMYLCILILLYNYLIAPAFSLPMTADSDKILNLIIVFSGLYSSGRTLEKITSNISIKEVLKRK